MDFLSLLSVFVLACFVGYYVVWSVTPALHTPLMAVTNAISSVIIVGALIAGGAGDGTAPTRAAVVRRAGGEHAAPPPRALDLGTFVAEREAQAPPPGRAWAKWLGLLAVVLASVNIFGGFAVTERMLAMYRRKERPAPARGDARG